MSFIPRCYGGAINGPENCTCDVSGSRLEQAEAARDAAVEYVEGLREKLRRAADRQRELMEQNRRLRLELREARA